MKLILFMSFLLISREACVSAEGIFPPRGNRVVDLQKKVGSYELTGRNLLIAEDKNGGWEIHDVMKLPPTTWFRIRDNETPSFGITSSVFWLQFSLQANDSLVTQASWLLEAAYPPLSELDLYTPSDSGTWKRTSGGNLYPFHKREIKYRNQMFRLLIPSDTVTTYYLRVRAVGSTLIPLKLHTIEAFAEQDLVDSMIMGVFYGAVLIMILYTIALFLSERDPSYIYYAFYALSYALFQAGNDGVSYQFLWPENSNWNYDAVLVFAGCIYFFNVLFTRAYLQTKTALPRFDKVLVFLAGVGICVTLSPLVVPFNVANKALTAFIVPAALLFYLVVAALRVRQGYRPAMYYGPALTLFMTGFLLRSLRINGVIPHSILTEYSAQIGILSELALLAFGLGDRFYTIRQEQVHLTAELKIKELEASQLRTVDHLKSQFFANISHEFRTPLTLILGPIRKWRGRMGEGEMGSDLSMMERNANRLLRLINQLLDLSKLEAGAMKLQAAPGNIVPFVKGIAQSFESSAGKRGVELTVEAEGDEIEMYFDRDKLEMILVNLLSNAFKFTSEGGNVSVSITRHASTPSQLGSVGTALGMTRDGFVVISVADTGIGIPQDQLGKIFDRFYQVDASQTREQEGSGIGLALTKELVELHHGTIEVTSEVGKGTTFTVRLPLGREHLKPEEITPEAPTTDYHASISEPRTSHLEPAGAAIADQRSMVNEQRSMVNEQRSMVNDQQSLAIPVVLIIEDNADVRAYLGSCLAPAYRIEEAYDGIEGITKATELIPDLIISDVMMPKMDGNEVCRRLKTDEKTSHIPIILLTAKAGQENKLDGLATGADDYLTKPFDAKELLVRVKNLIELRRTLREKFSIGKVLKPGEIAVTSVDDQFLQRAMAVVEKKMSDENFSVEEFAEEIGMSRSQLHRKLSALTTQSPGDFIRYMRLHRARELIQKDAGTISEIAFKAGFNSVSYFTKCFREQFGVVPSDLRTKKE